MKRRAGCRACQFTRWVLTLVILLMLALLVLSERGLLATV
jgi:hypothetical protein